MFQKLTISLTEGENQTPGMEYLAEAAVGLVAGLLGGLLGVGGSVLIIPALVFYLSQTPGGYDGSQQHLIQAAAMICNVFVVAPALLSHYRAQALQPTTLRCLVPGALLGMATGVYLSNTPFFARQRGAYLAIGLATFLAWEGLVHLWEFLSRNLRQEPPAHLQSPLPGKTAVVGIAVGLIGGLLGIGGGTLSIPLQCRVLAIPLRSAIANSAATIMVVSACGALYKNLTLGLHGFSIGESIRLALMIIPTAMMGSYLGGRLTHSLPRRVLQLILIGFFFGMAILTYERALAGLRRYRQDLNGQASYPIGLRHLQHRTLCQELPTFTPPPTETVQANYHVKKVPPLASPTPGRWVQPVQAAEVLRTLQWPHSLPDSGTEPAPG